MKNESVLLADILQAAELAQSYIKNVTKEAFLQDTQLQDSVVRRIEIIGEAARHLSHKKRSEIPQVPWHKVIAMRNLLIHDYGDVDMDVVWDAATQDLPPLIAAIEPLIPPETP